MVDRAEKPCGSKRIDLRQLPSPILLMLASTSDTSLNTYGEDIASKRALSRLDEIKLLRSYPGLRGALLPPT